MTTVSVHFGHLCSVTTTRFTPIDSGVNVTVTFRVASNKTRKAQEYSATVPFDAGAHNSGMIGAAWDQMMLDPTVRDPIVQFVLSELEHPAPNKAFDVLAR
jgi:hypothetical protein